MKEKTNIKSDLKQSETLLRSLISHSTEIISILDEKGQLLFISPPVEIILGWKPEELIGNDFSSKIHPDDLSTAADTFEKVVKNHQQVSQPIEIRCKHKNSGWKVLESVVTNLIDVPEIAGIVVHSHDITDRVLMEDTLVEQNEEIGLYLDILSHDLRNYHTTALSFIGLAALETTSPEIKHYISRAEANITRSYSLLNNITILMKDRLPFNYELEKINLLQTIEKVKDNLKEIYPERKIEITSTIPPETFVKADSLFDQLILNLLSNSIKNDAQETAKVVIQLEKVMKEALVISITDQAGGIAPEQREEIFERFREFRRKGRGSGLGLYIVKTLVDRYDGKVWIESRVKDDYRQGTRFLLELKKG